MYLRTVWFDNYIVLLFLLTTIDYCGSIDYRNSLKEVLIMINKLFDSELKVMEIIWENSPVSAKNVSLIAADTIGWNKNTTYTILKKLETKGYILRNEPGFICTPICSKSEVQKTEADSLIKKLFNGSRKALFSSLIEEEPLSQEEIETLRNLINSK